MFFASTIFVTNPALCFARGERAPDHTWQSLCQLAESSRPEATAVRLCCFQVYFQLSQSGMEWLATGCRVWVCQRRHLLPTRSGCRAENGTGDTCRWIINNCMPVCNATEGVGAATQAIRHEILVIFCASKCTVRVLCSSN